MPMLMPGQEEEVAGSGLVMGPGAQEGKLGGEEAKLTPSAPRPPWEGCGGPWVGMVLVKVGQVPALCLAGAGTSLTVCVGG